MSTFWRETRAVARLDWAEVVRSRWLVFCGAAYALLAGVFVLVGLRESSMLGFTGMGRVLMSMTHALLLLLPLLALTATGQVVNRARDDGSLELLFSHPVRRGAYFLGVTCVRLGVLVVPLVLLMFLMGAVGALAFGQRVPWDLLSRSLVIAAALLFAFVGLGMAVSTLVRSQARALLWILLLWAAGVAAVDFALIGVMLQWRLNPQAVLVLASLNPVQSARMALLSGVSSELSALGPVLRVAMVYVGLAGLSAMARVVMIVTGADPLFGRLAVFGFLHAFATFFLFAVIGLVLWQAPRWGLELDPRPLRQALRFLAPLSAFTFPLGVAGADELVLTQVARGVAWVLLYPAWRVVRALAGGCPVRGSGSTRWAWG